MSHEFAPVSIPVDGPDAGARELSGHVLEAAEPRAAVVIHPATAVSQNLYRAFAARLAERGFSVLIYDYTGCEESAKPGDLRRRDIRMSTWMFEDIPSTNAWAREHWRGLKLLAVGHSVGSHGQIAVQRDSPVDALAMIASHAGVTALIPEVKERVRVWAFFNLVVPTTAKTLGWVPVEQLGMGKPVPVGMLTQWRRWTRLPGYFFDDPEFDFAARYAQAALKVQSTCMDDDLWATRKATNVLTDQMTRAEVEKLDIATEPGDSLGHMGFFRSKNAKYWPRVTEWLEERAR